MSRNAEFRDRVGARIRRRRIAAGLSQRQLARQLSETTEGGQVSRWERGESFPAYDNLRALSRAFGITEEQLLCDGNYELP